MSPSRRIDQPDFARRTLLRAGLFAAAGLALPLPALARFAPTGKSEKTLSFYNTHTGEEVKKAVFWAGGSFVPETLTHLNFLLRDHRTGEVERIDPQLFLLIHNLRQRLDSRETIHIISGYRSPASNQLLRKTSSGVAKHSLHMDGKAMDLRVPGRDLSLVRKTALALKAGGVGYYPDSNFVHVDTGRVRFW